MSQRVYESKPLECWGKLKELRRQQVRATWSAKEKGELLLMGVLGFMTSLPAGFGEYRSFGLGPNFGRIMDDRETAVRCLATAEAEGYDLDTCPTLRSSLGALLMGMFDVSPSGERVKPELLLEIRICQPQGKFAQLWHEYYGVPHYLVEVPPSPDHADYLVAQAADAIDWMCQVTGRPYDDEKLIQAVRNEWESRVLWARMCMAQQAIPAPLDQRMLFSFEATFWRGRHQQEAVELMRVAVDEVEDRAKRGIAALATEQCRLLHEGVATWYYSQVLRHPKRYGAIFIGSQQIFGDHGAYIVRQDNSITPAPTLEELGRSLRSREEALRALAELYLAYSPHTFCGNMENRVGVRLKVAEDWHADGVVLNLERGCKGTTAAHMETAYALKERGIPTMLYEGSGCNPQEFNEGEYLSRFDSFMESLGLKPREE